MALMKFSHAVKNNRLDIVTDMINKSFDVSYQNNITLKTAFKKGNYELIEIFKNLPLERGIDFGCNDQYLIKWACRYGDIKAFKYLIDLPLDRGVDVSNVPLRLACEKGCVEIVRLLLDLPLERGVDPSVENNDALCTACSGGHFDIVKMLLDLPLERGVDPSVNENYPFRITYRYTHGIALLLLSLDTFRGVDPKVDEYSCLWNSNLTEELFYVIMNHPNFYPQNNDLPRDVSIRIDFLKNKFYKKK